MYSVSVLGWYIQNAANKHVQDSVINIITVPTVLPLDGHCLTKAGRWLLL